MRSTSVRRSSDALQNDERPEPTNEEPQHLCLDKGYAGTPVDGEVRERGYVPHVPRKGNEPTKPKRVQAHVKPSQGIRSL